MAKSLKKSGVAQSSDSYEEDPCQPCSFDGKTVSSENYCVECEVYLCTKCSGYHKKLKSTQDHKLISKKEAKSPHAVVKDKCSVKCTVHKDKKVKYFCKTHNVLGCTVCITMEHKQCDNVDYIPTVAADIKHNDDFKKFDEKLKAIEAACKAGISDVKKNLKVTETDHGQLKDAMQELRKQVIGALDKLENELMTKAGSIMREEKKKLDELSKKLSKHQADANAMIKQADTLLSSGKHCDTYVYMKNATKQLVSLDEELKRTATGNTLQRYEFQPNMDTLKTIASGKLSCRTEESGSSYRDAVSVPAMTGNRPMPQPHKQRTSDGSAGSRPDTHPMAQRFKPGTRVRQGGRYGIVVGPVSADGRCQGPDSAFVSRKFSMADLRRGVRPARHPLDQPLILYALVVRFLTRRFIWEYDPTLECTYKHATTIDDEPVVMEILDTAGQEWTIHREGHIRWADGFILVYAINDKQSFEEVVSIKQYLDDIKKTNVQCILVGNKIDLLHEVNVPTSEGERLASDWACAFFETSASDGGAEITELFYELHREIRRRKMLQSKPRRRSSAHQMRQVFTKMFKPQASKLNSPT